MVPRLMSRWDAAEVAVFEPVGVAFEGDDFGVVDEPVDHGGGDDVVAEDFAPAAEGLVAGDDQAGAFVAGGDELEEQVGGFGFEGDVADLVDDEQRVAAQADAARLGAGRRGGPRRAGRPTRRRWRTGPGGRPGRRGSPRPVARWVLPVPGGPRKTTFSLAATKSRVPRWAIRSRLRPRAWSKSNSSRRLAGGEPGGADAALTAVGLPRGDLALQAGDQELLMGPGLGSGPARPAGRPPRAAWAPSAPGSGTRPRAARSRLGRAVVVVRGGHHATRRPSLRSMPRAVS